MTSRSSIVAATIFEIASVLVFIIQPGYVQALVDLGGMSGAQAGYVASAEMIGYAATMILMTMLSHRLPWRPMLATFVALQASGTLACLVSGDANMLMAARFVAGLGAGGLSSIGFTAIGMTRDPDRQFGFLIMWVLAYGAVGLFGLPSLLAVAGLHGFYMIVAGLTVMSLALLRYLPTRGGSAYEAPADAVTIAVTGRLIASVSIFVFFLGCGILWAYVSLIGDAFGLLSQDIATGLSLSQFSGVAGALAAGLIAARAGRVPSLVGGLLLSAVSAASILLGSHSALIFGLAVCAFNCGWNFAQPIFLSAATGFDRRGRLVTQMVAAQSCGLALGPLVGAEIGGNAPGASLIFSVTILFICSSLLIMVPFTEARRARRPDGTMPATLPLEVQ